MIELFVQVPNETFEISNFGRVKRNGRIFYPGGANSKSRYTQIRTHNGTRTTHRIVWEAFNGPIPNGYEVNHIDENTHNNRLDNLNLMTHEENIQYTVSKTVLQFDKNGNFIAEFSSITEAGKALNLNSPGNIGYCVT